MQLIEFHECAVLEVSALVTAAYVLNEAPGEQDETMQTYLKHKGVRAALVLSAALDPARQSAQAKHAEQIRPASE